MKTQQQQSSRFKLSIKSMLILSLIILFSCSHRLLAQQKDGEETNSAVNSSSNAAPSRSAVNFNFTNVTLLYGEFLEAFGANNSRGILRGHLTIPGTELGTTTADPLMFSTNNTERMRILPNGKVGIGTSNPQDALHVFDPSSVSTIRLQGGNTNAGFISYWDPGEMLLLTNNRNPLNGVNFNPAAAGVQLSLWGTDIQFAAIGSGGIGAATDLMRIKGNGRVGIGTINPAHQLDVQGGAVNASGGLCINGDCKTAWLQVASQWTTSGPNIFYSTGSEGNVGIGTGAPTSKLHVAGAGRFTGNLTVDGNIAAKYQDVAEWVPAAEQLDAGTVVVLDSSKSNQVISSSKSYDTRVAGVISAQPGITLGEKSDDKVLVATTGRVLVNVDATNGPIQIGDLLVTSDREGLAMKSLPVEIGGTRIHRPGTLIGKALEPLASGTGKILVLLSLQ